MNPPGDEAVAAQPPHWGLWGTLLWGGFIAGVYVVLQLVTVFAVALARAALQAKSEAEMAEALQAASTDGTLIAISVFVTTIFGCGLVALVVKLKKGSVLKDYLALRPVSSGAFAFWMSLLVIGVALEDMLTLYLGRPVVPPFVTAVYASADPAWLLWVAFIVGAPLFEEVFFRGFLFKGLAATPLRPAGTVLVIAAAWAATHQQYDAYGIGQIFVLGLLIGAARVHTGSLLPPIAMHAATGLIATVEAAMLA